MPHTTKRLSAIALLCFFVGHALYAQIDKVRYMPLQRTASGHYAFYTLVNDRVMSKVMIESGIHTAIIDSAFFFRHKRELGMEAFPNDKSKEMNLGGKIYRISHRAKGDLRMGNMEHRGEVLILADYENDTPITLPIQNLHHRNDWGSRIVMLDLDGGRLQMLTRGELRQRHGKRYKLNRRTYRKMPAIKCAVTFDTAAGQVTLRGNFNIDLGNPMLLYLRAQSMSVEKILDEGKGICLSLGSSRSGDVIKTLIPRQCTLLEYTFDNPVVCITDKLPQFTTEGLIGLPFFKGRIAVFDFENNYLYMEE